MQQKITVGISSCLLGNHVRHDGGHKHHSFITGTLGEYFDFVPFCPEVGAGLGTPRPPIRLVGDEQVVRVVGSKDPNLDVTDDLVGFCESKMPEIAHLGGFILKKDSPSCGMERVKIYSEKGHPAHKGSGVFAKMILENYPNLPVEEEGRLGDARLRENFIERIFIYQRWRELMESGLSVSGLMDFHARHKLNFMSRHQDKVRELGRITASANSDNLEQAASEYFDLAMKTLKKLATVKNHVNVLHHAMGYLKRELDGDDKQEMLETIESYRLMQVPLIVPITLIKHHFRRSPHPYIENSWYFSPYPDELKLRNGV
ncbi:DUF523 and DUF1722 domain-containing protein [Porticoccaceae bacterium LTM1]|nr:DUF523 and DUF1722 domain-containing protein [Porticoccaceae bacterium LTM1]